MCHAGLANCRIAEWDRDGGIDTYPKTRILRQQTPADLTRLVDAIEGRKGHDEPTERRGIARVLACRDAAPSQSLLEVAAGVMGHGEKRIIDVQVAVERRQSQRTLGALDGLPSAPEIAHRRARQDPGESEVRARGEGAIEIEKGTLAFVEQKRAHVTVGRERYGIALVEVDGAQRQPRGLVGVGLPILRPALPDIDAVPTRRPGERHGEVW